MDYFEIGQRIRKYRKAKGLLQDELAEKVDISTTHMSHIETGNTKLSLPVLVSLAEELDVRVDDLLFDYCPVSKTNCIDGILSNLNDCSVQQLDIISDVVNATLISLKKHL